MNWIALLLACILLGFLIWIIVSQVKDYFMSKNPKLHELKDILRNSYLPNGDKLVNNNILDKISIFEGEKSYTINKEKVYICLYDEDGDYYSNNTLMYVVLHELSHILCDEIGHTEKFHSIFDDILDKASVSYSNVNGEVIRVYNPSIPIPSDYCNYN